MYRKILVPLDGSMFAEAALPYALAVCRKAGGTLELVTVKEPNPTYAHNDWTTAVREWSEAYLAEVAERVRSATDADVKTTLLEGVVWEALQRRAQQAEADLVVMATHGRGALSRAWLGSTADTFMRHTDRPVLLVRPTDDKAEPSAGFREVSIDRVLISLDGSDFSRSVIEPATALGGLFGARYTLLRVVAFPAELWSPYLPQSVQMNVETVEEARQAALGSVEKMAAELRGRGFEADADVLVDTQAANAILRRSDDLDSSLIALATRGRGGLERVVLGSTTDKVIRGSNRPVLVVRASEED